MTAGSCVPSADDSDSIGQMRIRLNEVRRLVGVSQVFVHEKFNRTRFEADYDIALIKLKQPLNFKTMKTIQPACLDAKTKNVTTFMFAGEQMVAGNFEVMNSGVSKWKFNSFLTHS